MMKELKGCFVFFAIAAVACVILGFLVVRNYGDHKAYTIQITDMSTSAQPRIGRVVTLRVKVKSSQDEPNTSLTIRLPKGVKLVEGDLVWKGSLAAKKTQTHDLSVCVLYEGDWRIEAVALTAPPDSTYIDAQDKATIHFLTTSNSARTVQGNDYVYESARGITQAPIPETPPAGICP